MLLAIVFASLLGISAGVVRNFLGFSDNNCRNKLHTYTLDSSLSCSFKGNEYWQLQENTDNTGMVTTFLDSQCTIRSAGPATFTINSCTATTTFGGLSAMLDCLHPSSLVRTARRGLVPLSSVALGEEVQTFSRDGTLRFSPVYTNTHYDNAQVTTYSQLVSESGARLLASPNHYVLTARGGCGAATPEFVPAGVVRAGDGLFTAGNAALRCVTVANASETRLRGLASPYTLSGTIIVDGFAASVYSSKVHPDQAHLHAAWARWAWRASAFLPAWLLADRLVLALVFAGSREAVLAATVAAGVMRKFCSHSRSFPQSPRILRALTPTDYRSAYHPT